MRVTRRKLRQLIREETAAEATDDASPEKTLPGDIPLKTPSGERIRGARVERLKAHAKNLFTKENAETALELMMYINSSGLLPDEVAGVFGYMGLAAAGGEIISDWKKGDTDEVIQDIAMAASIASKMGHVNIPDDAITQLLFKTYKVAGHTNVQASVFDRLFTDASITKMIDDEKSGMIKSLLGSISNSDVAWIKSPSKTAASEAVEAIEEKEAEIASSEEEATAAAAAEEEAEKKASASAEEPSSTASDETISEMSRRHVRKLILSEMSKLLNEEADDCITD
jgi:hypothetical protein